MGAATQGREAPSQPSPRGRSQSQPPKTQQEWTPAPWGGPGRGFWSTGEGLLPSSSFSTGASRTFFTANGGFFYRGYCWRHAWHDGGDAADAQEENLFSDRHWRQHRQGEAASSGHGFLCLFQPHPNLPQGEGVKAKRIKKQQEWTPAPCVSPSPTLPKGRAFHTTTSNTARDGLPPLGRAGEGLLLTPHPPEYHTQKTSPPPRVPPPTFPAFFLLPPKSPPFSPPDLVFSLLL